jgi:hypothetical protein
LSSSGHCREQQLEQVPALLVLPLLYEALRWYCWVLLQVHVLLGRLEALHLFEEEV